MASSNRLNYSRRLFLWLVVYSVVMVGCFAVFQYHREKAFKAEELNTRLQLINTYLLSELYEGREITDIDLAEFRVPADMRVSVIDSGGTVIYDNSLDTLPGASHLDRAEIRLALRNGNGYTVRRHSESTGDYYFYSAAKGDNGYIVRTAVPYSLSLSSLLRADFGFLWAMGIIALGMCVLGYFATRRIGEHITRLSEFAGKVEEGQRISDTAPFPDDEFGEISNHIVRLYARLQQAIADRDTEHRAALHQQCEKERIKKQLTDNINHELKTPVAAIKVCLETLADHPDMAPEKKRMFLERSIANTDRLQRLLNDVALITRMDDGTASIEKEPVNLAAIVAETVENRREIAAAKGIAITRELPAQITVNGNAHLLETIFSNLIDNAIAYSGGSSIHISLPKMTGERIEIELYDNGTGIPAEHLPRIFERFYRIDKGRSRAAGGTGLGLSIVKNAVLFHGGTITAANRPSGGLRFTLRLPLGAGRRPDNFVSPGF